MTAACLAEKTAEKTAENSESQCYRTQKGPTQTKGTR